VSHCLVPSPLCVCLPSRPKEFLKGGVREKKTYRITKLPKYLIFHIKVPYFVCWRGRGLCVWDAVSGCACACVCVCVCVGAMPFAECV
jgi:hypothetical protein